MSEDLIKKKLDKIAIYFENTQKNEIVKFESKVMKIPNEYKIFIEKYSSIRFNSLMKFFLKDSSKNSKNNFYFFREFFLFDAENTFIKNYECYNGRIEKFALPIGSTPNGDVIYLHINDRKIYLWNHEREGFKDSKKLISDSFEEFIESLEVVIEDNTPVQGVIDEEPSEKMLKLMKDYKKKNPDAFLE